MKLLNACINMCIDTYEFNLVNCDGVEYFAEIYSFTKLVVLEKQKEK